MKRPESPCMRRAKAAGVKTCPDRNAECHVKGHCIEWDEYKALKAEFDKVVRYEKNKGK